MPLVDALLRTYFGSDDPPAELEVGLSLDGVEVVADGYRRQRLRRGRWSVSGPDVSGDVTFGPFPAGFVANGTFLAVGDEILDAQPLDGGGRTGSDGRVEGFDLNYKFSLVGA